MAKTKKSEESTIESAEEAIGKIAEKVEEKIKSAAESAKEIVGNVLSEKSAKKKKNKEEKKPKAEKKEKQSEKKEEEKKEETEQKSEDKKAKLSRLLEKAKVLESAVEESKEIDLKKQLKPEEEEVNTLVPIEDYLKSSIHLGSRVITPNMRQYVYKRRADGLAVFNTSLVDKKLREGAEFLAKFAPENIVVVCKREAGWKAVSLFSKITGVRIFTKKYPAGILTNTKLDNFFETELVVICDPWLDKNALSDAIRIKIPVLSICDTNNFAGGISQFIIGNNKSAKSLGMIFYLLAKLYVEKRGIKAEVPSISEFIDNWDNLQPAKTSE